MPLPRLSGILLHPTSLPGPHGSGDLGSVGLSFCRLAGGRTPIAVASLAADRHRCRQFALHEPVCLCRQHFADRSGRNCTKRAGWTKPIFTPNLVFQNSAWIFHDDPFSHAPLAQSGHAVFRISSKTERASFDAFCVNERTWLDDYALFLALEQAQGENVDWQDWPAPLAKRDRTALRDATAIHANEIHFLKFCQWQFFDQWARLKTYANERGVEIIGDVPIFVAPHSVDVWANPHLFELNAKGRPTVVAGVPPDKFSETGQLWGNPLYRWAAHTKDGFQWWAERMRRAQELFDWVRIDHFRGFESYWEIPADAKTAIAGKWRPGPKSPLFVAMRKQLGKLRVIAEDLGVITPEVNALRKELNFPGMRVLQFAFGAGSDNLYLPHNYEADTVVYTGTHDNDTTRGWWQSIPEYERDHVRRYLSVNGEWIQWDLIRAHTLRWRRLPLRRCRMCWDSIPLTA